MSVKYTKEGTSVLDYMSHFEHTLIYDKLKTIDFAGFYGCQLTRRGAGSVVGIATAYWLDGRGSNPGGGEIFRTCPDRP